MRQSVVNLHGLMFYDIDRQWLEWISTLFPPNVDTTLSSLVKECWLQNHGLQQQQYCKFQATTYFETLQKDKQVCPLPKDICAQQVGDNQIIICAMNMTHTLMAVMLIAILLHLLTVVVSHHLKLTSHDYQLQYFKILWHLIFHPTH